MATLHHHHDPFAPQKRTTATIDKPMTVRRLVQKHKALRRHTHVYRPGGVYGRRRVREFSRMTLAVYNGVPLPRSAWKRTVVRDGDVLSFAACLNPKGGAALKIGIAIAALVVVTVLTAGIGTALFGAAATGSAGLLGVGGTLFGSALAAGAVSSVLASAIVGAVSYGLMSLFASPATPSSSGTGYSNSTPASSPVYNLTAQGNYARLGSAIPEPLGRNRLFPDFVATPYVQYFEVDPDEVPGAVESTTDQYLHHIVGLGIGEYEIDEDSLKLGDTPITSYPDIEWAVIEPGEESDTAIADERWITSPDLADVELLDDTEGSPYAGPYAANPPQTVISRIEVDLAAPRGLWAFNTVSSDLDAREVEFEVEAQEIDDLGVAVGDPDVWETFDPLLVNRRSQDPQRFMAPFTMPTAGRWQVRVRRTDVKDTSIQAGHQLDWIGLRGRIIGRRTFQNMTCIALKMKAGSALNSAQARQFNLVATRKLPTWDDEAGAMTTALAATRSPCDAFAHIALTSNGGRLSESQVDLAALYANDADFTADDWTFDFVFDQSVTVSEALARVARAVVAERVTQGGKLHLIRDVPVVAPVAMFSPRNIAPGSLSISYALKDSTSPDALIGTYIDQTVWRPIDVTVAFDDSAQERPSRLTLHGVGNRDQARAVLWNLARADRYRRRVLGWSTAMEGLAVTFGDGISFSHDVPNYGQTLEVVDVDDTDPNAPIFTFVDPPDFSDTGATYYAAVRDSLARKAGPFVATAVEGEPLKLELTVPDPGDLPEILIGGDKERTWLQLGPGEAYARPLKVKTVTPRDSMSADIVAFDDDDRMYDELPDEPEVPIGAGTETLEIAITEDDGPTVNLRSLANENDYTGLAVQQVNFTLAADVDVAIERGSWPVGAVPALALAGGITGLDGTAGTAGTGGTPSPFLELPGDGIAGGAGGAGGTALDSSTGALTLTGAGTIRGGKGGGGGGGGAGGSYTEDGGGGHLLAGGDGGAGNGGSGSSGSSYGGATSGNGGNGGAQGAYGAAGSAGASGTDASGGIWNGAGAAGGAGGAAGKAILGIANVDLTGFTGAIVGTTA